MGPRCARVLTSRNVTSPVCERPTAHQSGGRRGAARASGGAAAVATPGAAGFGGTVAAAGFEGGDAPAAAGRMSSDTKLLISTARYSTPRDVSVTSGEPKSSSIFVSRVPPTQAFSDSTSSTNWSSAFGLTGQMQV